MELVKQGTMTGIQGFPAEASTQSISDIVKELKRAGQKLVPEAPPSPPSIAAALAQIKKNGIEKQSTLDSKAVGSTSKSSLFGITNVVSNKTFDQAEEIAPKVQIYNHKQQSIKFQAPTKEKKQITLGEDVYQGIAKKKLENLNTFDIGLVVSDLPDKYVEESIEQTVKHHDSLSTPPNGDQNEFSPRSSISASWDKKNLLKKSSSTQNPLSEVVPPLKPTQQTVVTKKKS